MSETPDILHSSGASWEGELHAAERTLSWSVDPCGEVQTHLHTHTVDGYRYGQGEQTVWLEGDTLHRLTVEVQTTVTLETVRCEELSPLERELGCVESRLEEALEQMRALGLALEGWEGE